MDPYLEAASYADRIEAQLREMKVWDATPPPPSAFESPRAFFGDTMTFFQWLQFVLLARVREIVATRGRFPRESAVGTYAVRELDGMDQASDLVHELCEFDQFIERIGGRVEKA
jgi:uncharacterized protein YqcC (DUF446 family)